MYVGIWKAARIKEQNIQRGFMVNFFASDGRSPALVGILMIL